MIAGLVAILIGHQWRWLGPKVDGGSRNNSATAYHSLFGVISVGLAWTQPLGSLLRCLPTNPRRVWFNVQHRLVGVLSWILAVITIGIACINFTKVFTDHNAATALCMVFVLATFVVFMACELRHQLKLRKKEVYNPEEAEDMQERESFGFDLKLL
ncbi:Protein M03A1.3, partial [Aphelenchoides avenae]